MLRMCGGGTVSVSMVPATRRGGTVRASTVPATPMPRYCKRMNGTCYPDSAVPFRGTIDGFRGSTRQHKKVQ